MAVTRLERKVKRTRVKAQNRQRKLKHLLSKPVIKNIDIEAIKQSFTTQPEASKEEDRLL
jgi:hypothetical protein